MSAGFDKARVAVPPRIVASDRASIYVLTTIGALVLLGGGVLYFFNPTESHFFPLCAFHQTTGLLCPGCGSLRALHHLLNGHLSAALHCNVLLILSLPLIGSWLVWCRVRRQPAVLRAAWAWAGLGVVVLFGVLRNLPFAQLAWLAP